VFGLCCLLGFLFAPRIKDLKDRKLYTIEKPGTYLLLEPLIGGVLDPAAIIDLWPELLRLKASIEAGAVHGLAVGDPAQACRSRSRQCSVARPADARSA
jgi:TnpA family transposase